MVVLDTSITRRTYNMPEHKLGASSTYPWFKNKFLNFGHADNIQMEINMTSKKKTMDVDLYERDVRHMAQSTLCQLYMKRNISFELNLRYFANLQK